MTSVEACGNHIKHFRDLSVEFTYSERFRFYASLESTSSESKTTYRVALGTDFPKICISSTQAWFTYRFKVLDLTSSKGDWAYYDRELRKDKATSGYYFLAHRVDLYAKALMRGASNYSFHPQQGNSFYGTNQPVQQIHRGYWISYKELQMFQWESI